jgi:acetylornithine deacetylase/succinyl-diaminopimelate desuccinylase-like protein
MHKAAEWLLGYVRQMGLNARIYETAGNPIIFAELCRHKNAPTLLIYSHYDVAPPGRMEEWKTLPFSPVRLNGSVYARGAVDDKGQLFAVLQGIKSVLAVEGKLPVNVKLLFDGEEEMGSPSMDAFTRKYGDMLSADIVVVVDILKYRNDMPAIYYSSKGLLSVILEVSGPAMSIHSGIYGGDIANPAEALARMLAGLKDRDGKISISGFYNSVRDITPEERADFASLPFDRDGIKALLGVEPIAQEKGYTPIECVMARPTLSINGLWGGALPGAPIMIIPSTTGALVSMRLVPDQRPEEVFRLFEDYVNSMVTSGVRVKLQVESSREPFITPRDSPAVRIAGHALEYAFGHRPVLVRSGGTSGIVSLLKKATSIQDIIATGWGDPGDGEHAPNEHFSIENYRRGIIATAATMYELARMKKPAKSERIVV